MYPSRDVRLVSEDLIFGLQQRVVTRGATRTCRASLVVRAENIGGRGIPYCTVTGFLLDDVRKAIRCYDDAYLSMRTVLMDTAVQAKI